MEKTTVRSALVTTFVFSIISCTNTVPNNVRTGSGTFPATENFQDLDREYKFATKELTQSYLKRKIEKWLDTANAGANPDGPKLLKEIAYAKNKFGQLFCSLMEENTGMLAALNAVSEISDRKTIDASFKVFIDGCVSAPPDQGNEFQVNTYTTLIQINPSVAIDNDGDFVITWASGYPYGGNQDGSGYGIYAQRYNASGLAQGSEFRVNSYTTGSQNYPAVAINNSGDFIITWHSNSQDGNLEGVYAQKFYSSGAENGSEFRVNTYTANAQKHPAVAIDEAGNFVITWMSYLQEGKEWETYARRYDSNGAVSSEFRVNSYPTGAQYFPAIAMNDAGNFVITWMSYDQVGNGWECYAQRYSSTGTFLGSEFIVNTYTTGQQQFPSVAMDAAGDFVITWQSDGQDEDYSSGVFARMYSAAGVPLGSEFEVNSYTTSSQGGPSVAMDSDGDFVVSWYGQYINSTKIDNYGYEYSTYGYGIFARRYNSAGITQGSEFRVNNYTTSVRRNPAAAMDSDGDFVFTWTGYGDQDSSNAGIFAKRYNSSGFPQ
jgi:hypothetical protein